MKKIKAKDIKPGDTFLFGGRAVKATSVGSCYEPGFPRNASGLRVAIRTEGGPSVRFRPDTHTHLVQD